MKNFQQTQLAFTRHLRAPAMHAAPPDIEERRITIYRELIYNNMESFIAGAFPVLHSLLPTAHWHAMLRDFMVRHACQTPYFLDISQEFLTYLVNERGQVEGDPPFMLELAHYEWVELALDVADINLPVVEGIPATLLDKKWQLSPLAWCLTYQFPVHKISCDYQPQNGTPTLLLVYRNRADDVKFMEINSLTARFIYLLQTGEHIQARAIFEQIAQELRHPQPLQLITEGEALIVQLFELDIIYSIE